MLERVYRQRDSHPPIFECSPGAGVIIIRGFVEALAGMRLAVLTLDAQS